mgnify:CR=1 FL=1
MTALENNFDLLKSHLLKRISLTDEEFKASTAFFKPKKLKKKQYLLQERFVQLFSLLGKELRL